VSSTVLTSSLAAAVIPSELHAAGVSARKAAEAINDTREVFYFGLPRFNAGQSDLYAAIIAGCAFRARIPMPNEQLWTIGMMTPHKRSRFMTTAGGSGIRGHHLPVGPSQRVSSI
jgi:hypothetical protein